MLKGAAAEQAAADYLATQGLTLVARNYRCRGGEIDLILRDGVSLVFVEVRERAGSAFGGAAASITATKQARLRLAAQHYLNRHGLDLACRFDAVLVQGGRMEWLRAVMGA
ncbi:MAG: YraN family protein [Pseudomonadota bacterium]|nr:YraN family protein [Pseudomonadota bacterium]MDP1572940.1 YraN family protein [Pseudomonadota bacterium]MDP1906176.1 YraN family protein [Pseudomonadota bacterium]